MVAGKCHIDESVEEYSEHEPEGMMFPSDHKVNNCGVVV